jgi:hypothetical protein
MLCNPKEFTRETQCDEKSPQDQELGNVIHLTLNNRMIEDLSPVILTQDILYRGKSGTVAVRRPGHKILPRGSRGTVVGVWADGCAYEVEFMKPFHCLITIEADELKLYSVTETDLP